MKKIFITGGLGFIGTNLSRYIADHSTSKPVISIIDSLISGSKNQISDNNAQLIIKADICDSDLYENIVDENTTVVHLAALGNVVQSITNPIDNFNANVKTTVHLLEMLRKNNCKSIVFASTGGALMGNTKPPVSELSLPMPISPYGASKLSCEGYIHAYCESYGMRAAILRFGNVYGRYSAHKKGVINTWINQSLINNELVIYGDGSSTRDYVHVTDLCQGIYNSIEYLSECKPGRCEVFHLSTGAGTTLQSLANIVLQATNSKSNIRYAHSRAGEVDKNFASPTKAAKMLGFCPQISIENGILDLVSWLSHEPINYQI